MVPHAERISYGKFNYSGARAKPQARPTEPLAGVVADKAGEARRTLQDALVWLLHTNAEID